MSTHLRNGLRTACGRQVTFSITVTDQTRGVDCDQCRGTRIFRDRRREEQVNPAINVDALNSNLTATQAAIKAALDEVFNQAWELANDAGHCETFDEIVNDIVVPAWYTIPPRRKKWRIEVRYSAEVEAADEDGAWEVITDDPQSYLNIYANQ